MATWKNLSEDEFKIDYPGDAGYSGKRRLTLQYDSETINPESVKVRFKWYQPGSTTTFGADIFYILYDANNTSNLRQLIKIKGYGSGDEEAYYTSSITLKKECDAKTFFLQDIWICNSGGTSRTDADAAYDTFKSGGSRGSVASGSSGLVYRQSAGQSISILPNKTVVPLIEGSTTKIVDNGNNTFTITATEGKGGIVDGDVVNPTKGLTDLDWGYTESYGNEYKSGDTITLTMTNKADATRTVYARSTTKATYGYNIGSAVSKEIKQYVAPKVSGKPALRTSSYKDGRLTLKQNWTYNWTAAAKTNDSSPIKGYQIRIYKNGTALTGLNYSAADPTKIYKGTNTANYLNRDNVTCDVVLTTEAIEDFGFKSGDKIKLSVIGYTRNGKNEVVVNSTAVQTSDETTIQSAGIMRIKVGGTWKEGQAYIKINGAWKEAQSVHIKTSGAWKESI